jgi:hypothetical protein
MRSHIKASSQPPPRAWPETAARMGFFMAVVKEDQDLGGVILLAGFFWVGELNQ